MTVWSATDVDAAADAGVLRVADRDVVTPLARERARDLGIEIVVGGGVTPPAAAGPPRAVPVTPGPQHVQTVQHVQSAPAPLRPPSGAFFRRGGPLAPAVRPGAAAAARADARDRGPTGRVTVVGAGRVGMITALRLAGADVFAEVVLTDVDEGRARGIALDLTHAAALDGLGTRVRGTGTVEEAGPSDYVVIAAGRPRGPGTSRADLVGTDAAIVGDVARRVAATSPGAVIVVVSNPVDELTQHAWRSSGFPAERVLGIAGALDTARFQSLVGPTGVARPEEVDAVAPGSHGEELLAPGLSAARMVLAMARDGGEVLPAAVLADGAYGIRDVYVGLPARLGRGGVREVVEIELAPAELAALREAADRIRERAGALAAAS